MKRDVPVITYESLTVADPQTGCSKTDWIPKTEIKTVTELEYYAAPEKKVVLVQVPFLKRAEEVVPRKTLLLEYGTIMKKEGYPVAMPSSCEVKKDETFVAPQVECPSEK